MTTLEMFRKMHGPGRSCQPSSQVVLKRYQSKLPAELIEEWRNNGWCCYAEGQLWLVNPETYVDVVREWLPDWCGHDVEEPIVFARGAFGDVLVSHDGSVGHLNVHYGRYIDIGAEVDVFLGYLLDKGYISSALDGSLALKAIKKFGALSSDEMFTFEPALALGGEFKLEYVKKLKLFPQLSFLAQLFDEITIE